MGWIQMNINNDGVTDWGWDGDNDGRLEELWIDAHGDGDWDIRMIDANEDGHFEWMNLSTAGDDYRNMWISSGQYNYAFIDSDRNGTYDGHFYDGGRDGHYEYIRLDTNGDGHADTWYANDPPRFQDAGSVLSRQMAQQQANVAAVSVLFNAARVSGGIF